MRDLFVEIWESIRRNKMRTCLTGFAVAWGIFMLIVLLGAGNGLMNAFMEGGDDISTNTMQVGGGWTSKPYNGLKEGRPIELEESDVALTRDKVFADHIDEVTATIGADVTVSNGEFYCSGYIEGNYPSRVKMDKIELKYGRFIDDEDIKGKRKVVVLPDDMVENLNAPGYKIQNFIGSYVKIGGLSYKVVGITKADEMRGDNLFFAPYSTVKTIYNKGKVIDDLTFSFHGIKNQEENDAFEASYKAAVNTKHGAAPDDSRALWIWNRFSENLQMEQGRSILTIALWVIGLFTLLSGIVGVSNIMLITVKERTHEFGIRKAIGASPGSIMRLIITESVCITAFFGYVGMVLGMMVCEVLDKTLGQSTVSIMDEQVSMLVNPTVGIGVAVEATILLIVAGTLAGLFPARKAAKVRPIEALNVQQ